MTMRDLALEGLEQMLNRVIGLDPAVGRRLTVPNDPESAQLANTVNRLFDALGERDETFLEVYKRVGIDPFKEAVYGPDSKRAA